MSVSVNARISELRQGVFIQLAYFTDERSASFAL
jgi:hypothetical protein